MILKYSIQSKRTISELMYNHCKTNSCNFANLYWKTSKLMTAKNLKQTKSPGL